MDFCNVESGVNSWQTMLIYLTASSRGYNEQSAKRDERKRARAASDAPPARPTRRCLTTACKIFTMSRDWQSATIARLLLLPRSNPLIAIQLVFLCDFWEPQRQCTLTPILLFLCSDLCYMLESRKWAIVIMNSEFSRVLIALRGLIFPFSR